MLIRLIGLVLVFGLLLNVNIILMKIKDIIILRGPNFWSVRREKLIQMRLDLEELEDFPTNKIEGFAHRLEALIPSMYSHRCSEGVAGGFFSRVKEGTWMGHVIEHIALEIQTLAGMNVGFGRTRETKTSGVYNVVFAYEDEQVGIYTAKAAVHIAEALIANEDYDLNEDIKAMQEIQEHNSLGPSTLSIVKEAEARGIPWKRINNHSYIQFGYGANQVRIEATITAKTNYLAVEIACDKYRTKELLKNAFVPVARGGICHNEEGLQQVIDEVGYPIVIKPLDANHGKGVSTQIENIDCAKKGLVLAQKFSNEVIVEEYVSGYDFRILVVNHQLVAAAKREPAHIIGNGINTIKELIDRENENPKRGVGHEKVLTKIKIDQQTLHLLEKKGLSLDSTPSENEIIYLKSTANISTGGTSIDVTDLLHPDNIILAERISKIIDLDICGIDIIAPNLTESLYKNSGIILEVNAAPGFRMHIAPTQGLSRNVAVAVVDMLFPENKSCTIPIIAITGTNGKTTTTRLIAHLIKNNNHIVGYTTSDGIYIQDQLLEKGDTTGPISAKKILSDPTVEFAVLETARGGILREGLGFSRCDIGIITNITADHLGLKDIHTLDELARVKSLVVESVKKDGWAILNAEDEHCLKISENLESAIAYFALDENQPTILDLIHKGNLVAVYENEFITLIKGSERKRIASVSDVPLTMNGKAKFMIQNVLAATLAAYLSGLKVENIALSLQTFVPGPSQTPGRLNIFEFKNFKVMIDFAHNPAGYNAIKDYLVNVSANRKIGIISGVGDRRDEDIRACGRIAAETFDYIIIRQEKHLRGRTEEEIINLLVEGIHLVNKNFPYEVISKEIEAIEHTISLAQSGDFIIALSDVVSNAIEVVQNHLNNEK